MKENLKDLGNWLLTFVIMSLLVSALIFASFVGITYLEDYVADHKREQELKEARHKRLLMPEQSVNKSKEP